MSKTLKILNEGFMRKYMKEDMSDSLEKNIRNILQSKGYNVNADGADNYISAAAEYIDMSNEFGDPYSVEEWLKDTEMNYPEDLAFMKESCEECIHEDVEVKEIFHNENGIDYDVIERSSSGKNALLRKGNQWIVAWNCPQGEGSWGQGHYFFDEVEARKVWEDKYVNESLNEELEENDSFDFTSDVYDALSDVMFKYRDKGVDKSDMDYALGWFDSHFWEMDFEEKLQECIFRLNEAEMSDEDKADSAILRNIYNKTQQRANAKLTPEEKAVLDKYNLGRSSSSKNIKKIDKNGNPWGNALINGRIGYKFKRWDRDETKINLADRARKMDDRGDGYEADLSRGRYYDAPYTDFHREFKKPGDRNYTRLKDKGLLDRERRAQDAEMTEPVAQMKDAIKDRKYHQQQVDNNNAEYDAKRAKIQAEYEKKLKDNENSRKRSGEYHQQSLDRSKDTIDRLLRRDKKEEQ